MGWSPDDDGTARERGPASQRCEQYVASGVESGCALLTGGRPLADEPASGTATSMRPRSSIACRADSPLALEEIFGPVLPIVRVRDLDEAITVANGTRYGLAASIFTSRPGMSRRVHQRASKPA